MPKMVDNYVLEQKIGAGQFGDVFKGYHGQNKQEVAIKAIRRQTIKGKFYQLLQNEIKVLKTCDNANIIKLYAIKKTANHFYLMLEYCNQGDMLAYVRKLGTIPQEKVIKFLCQILNAFQDLVKHKIMHRDFKLANILLHNGNIKIADFGFAKLLATEDYATTMLGSPLNMAPEVLGGNKYNSKADIYSIGACIWEMLYGKPPYVAGNMVDLLNIIKTKPLKFPPNPVICEPLKDVLKKMLAPDSKRRIGWNELFNHPITTYLAKQLREQINLELIQDESLIMNTSKFYLKKNLVIDSADDIHQNQKMNTYLLDVIKEGKKKQQFEIQQTAIKTKISQKSEQTTEKSDKEIPVKEKQKKQKEQDSLTEKSSTPSTKTRPQSPPSSRSIPSTKTVLSDQNSSNLQQIFRSNLKKIMHYRNIYVFLANVSDEILSQTCFQNIETIAYKGNEAVAYFMVHKILNMIKWLLAVTKSQKSMLPNLENWELFRHSTQLKQIVEYIEKQFQVFKVFNMSIEPNIKKGFINGEYGAELKPLINGTFQQKTYKETLKKYIKTVGKQLVLSMLSKKQTEQFKPSLKHLEYCLIAYDTERVFGKQEFNFTQFYDSFDGRGPEQSLLRIERMIKQM